MMEFKSSDDGISYGCLSDINNMKEGDVLVSANPIQGHISIDIDVEDEDQQNQMIDQYEDDNSRHNKLSPHEESVAALLQEMRDLRDEILRGEGMVEQAKDRL